VSDTAGVVRFEQRGATAVITFDRPSARNAMTWRMYQELDEALDRVAANADTRVALFRGAGGHFVAGTDITQFSGFRSGDDGILYEEQLEVVIAKLEAMRVATIAAVQGSAVGAGLIIATACDLRIATPDARFGVPIARTVGNCLSMANYARLVATLGASRTKAMLLTTDPVPAEEARASGFVTALVEPEALEAQIDALCARIATYAPLTIQVTKEAVRRVVSRSMVDGDDLLLRAYGSNDFREGVSAFIEKRAPQWEGR
jgi:enoyl-CoA hydratase/carnithine racemase